MTVLRIQKFNRKQVIRQVILALPIKANPNIKIQHFTKGGLSHPVKDRPVRIEGYRTVDRRRQFRAWLMPGFKLKQVYW
jgi:hypothetical protein